MHAEAYEITGNGFKNSVRVVGAVVESVEGEHVMKLHRRGVGLNLHRREIGD